MFDLLDFKKVSDNRGDLTYINQITDVPFEIKRVFTLSNQPLGTVRGNHAHKQLIEVIIPLQGQLDVKLLDIYENETWNVNLHDPSKGLVLYPHVWRTLHNFRVNTICLVLCSEVHDETDYIRSWDEYINIYGRK